MGRSSSLASVPVQCTCAAQVTEHKRRATVRPGRRRRRRRRWAARRRPSRTAANENAEDDGEDDEEEEPSGRHQVAGERPEPLQSDADVRRLHTSTSPSRPQPPSVRLCPLCFGSDSSSCCSRSISP